MKTARLQDMAIDKVSLVDQGANKRKFALLKRNSKEDDMAVVAKRQEYIDALASGVAKGRGQTGPLATLRKLLGRVKKTWSASDHVSMATWALGYVLDLIECESAVSADDTDAAEDAQDVQTLRTAAAALSEYIAATAQEVGSPDDLEAIAAKTSQAAMNSYSSDVWMSANGKPDPDWQQALKDAVAKKGQKQFSAARLARLQEAAEQFSSVLDEIEAEEKNDDDESSGGKSKTKKVDNQEDEMTGEEITAAVQAAIEPLVKRVDKLEQPAATEPPINKSAGDDGDVSMSDIAKAIGNLSDRIERLEKGRSAQPHGQDESAGGVRKRGDSKLNGILTDV